MVTASKKFTIFLGILRVLGGFPYRWGRRAASFVRVCPSSLPSPCPSRSIWKSKGWLCWTVLVTSAVSLHVVACVYVTVRDGGAMYVNRTLNQTRYIYSLWKDVLLSLTAAFAICKSRALARIVEDADALCGTYELDADAFIQRHQIVNPIFWQSLTMVVVVVASAVHCAEDHCDAARYFTGVMDGVTRVAFPMILTLLYYAFNNTLSAAYSRLTTSLPRPHDRLDDPDAKLYSLDASPSGRPSKTRRHSPSGDALRLTLAELSLKDNEEINRFANQILHLQDFHRSLNGHFGAALTLVIAYCMSTCIITAFSLSFYSLLHWKDKVTNIFYLMHSFFPLVVLTNSPLVLEGEREKLQRVITQMFLCERDHQLKIEFYTLMHLLDEYKGISICGLFNLQRARLVNILSFITTYLVILLQFRVGDTSSA